MKHLTHRQNQVWQLADTCGWTTTRIALHLGVSKRAVNAIKARIRARLDAPRTPARYRSVRPGSFVGAWGT